MGFWLRHIIFGVVLIGLAYYLLANQDQLFSQVDVETHSDSSNKSSDSKNSAAEGLSSFYASINPNMDEESGPIIRNNIVYLPEPNDNVDQVLQDRSMVVRPIKKRWQGSEKSRPFRQGETLYQKMSEYANDEGIEVIWQLNRDFLVKDAFRVEKSIIAMAAQVGAGINGHFENGVTVFFCNKQRVIVFTDKATDYLKKDCQNLSQEFK